PGLLSRDPGPPARARVARKNEKTWIPGQARDDAGLAGAPVGFPSASASCGHPGLLSRDPGPPARALVAGENEKPGSRIKPGVPPGRLGRPSEFPSAFASYGHPGLLSRDPEPPARARVARKNEKTWIPGQARDDFY